MLFNAFWTCGSLYKEKCFLVYINLNPFSTNSRLLYPLKTENLTKWSNTLKQFIGKCRRIVWVCLTILWDFLFLRGIEMEHWLKMGQWWALTGSLRNYFVTLRKIKDLKIYDRLWRLIWSRLWNFGK